MLRLCLQKATKHRFDGASYDKTGAVDTAQQA